MIPKIQIPLKPQLYTMLPL
uniref:Uncharacterized protein n=1 Tax=Rhizophora mucronata TaxID=61149 RepID=A0A2P2NCP6_RHIMU